MAKEIVYRCNLCGDKSAKPEEFYGIHFGGIFRDQKRVSEFKIVDARNAETHICQKCHASFLWLYENDAN